MARIPVTTGLIGAPLTVVCDTQGKTRAVVMQNVSPTDFFVSDDPSTLQNTSPSNLPLVGLRFQADTAGITPFMLVLHSFNGKLYGRAQGVGAACETLILRIC